MECERCYISLTHVANNDFKLDMKALEKAVKNGIRNEANAGHVLNNTISSSAGKNNEDRIKRRWENSRRRTKSKENTAETREQRKQNDTSRIKANSAAKQARTDNWNARHADAERSWNRNPLNRMFGSDKKKEDFIRNKMRQSRNS